MSQVNPGAVIQYQASVTDTITLDPSQVISQVGQILSAEGLSIQDSSYTTPSVADQAEILVLQSFSLPFSVNLSVGVNGSYSSQDDVKSIIDNAFYQVTGQLPQSSSVPNILSNPGASAGATGETTQAGFSSSSIGDSISSFLNNLGTGTTFAIIAVIVIVVVIIAIVLVPDAPVRVLRSFQS